MYHVSVTAFVVVLILVAHCIEVQLALNQTLEEYLAEVSVIDQCRFEHQCGHPYHNHCQVIIIVISS